MKTIVLAMNCPELYQGGYRDKVICEKYRGSGWVPYFCKLAEEKGYQVLSGFEAVNKGIEPSECLVFQEELNHHAEQLIDMGAHPWVITCFESPLYSPHFYDHGPFNHQYKLFFGGGTHHLTFPSFDLEELNKPSPEWKTRKNLVMVCSNKFVHTGPQESPSFKAAKSLELQSIRAHAIKELKPDLYGYGWEHAPEVKDKIDLMRNYKYAVCYENVVWPGYITEKIIDCFVAGTIPLYLGAPDLYAHIPPQILYSPDLARSWLQGDDGRKYSYQGFAEFMITLLEEK